GMRTVFADASPALPVPGSSPFLAEAIAQDQDGQVAPAAPQRPHPRHAVALAVQVTPQAADPQHRLTHRGCGRVGLGPALLERGITAAPRRAAQGWGGTGRRAPPGPGPAPPVPPPPRPSTGPPLGPGAGPPPAPAPGRDSRS